MVSPACCCLLPPPPPGDFGLSARDGGVDPVLLPERPPFRKFQLPDWELAVRHVHRIEPSHLALPVSSLFRRLDLAGMQGPTRSAGMGRRHPAATMTDLPARRMTAAAGLLVDKLPFLCQA